MDIKEIASLAGVSPSTISRYLNGGYVSEKNRTIIAKIIEETGFKPDRGAIMLRTKKSKQIGVIIPKINSDSISRMIRGISKVLSEEGYYLLLADTDNNEMAEVDYLKLFKENNVDGIVLIGTVFSEKHEEAFKGLSVPLVILAQYHEKYPSVYYDDYEASKEMTKILAKNRKNVGLLSARYDDIAVGKSRTNGFLDGLKELGVSFDPQMAIVTPFDSKEAFQNTKKLLEMNPKLDAIFCATEVIASGAIQYLHSIGKKIPEEITIATVGNGYLSNLLTPTLSCAEFYYEESGFFAATMLLEQIKGHHIVDKKCIGFKLNCRQSTEK